VVGETARLIAFPYEVAPYPACWVSPGKEVIVAAAAPIRRRNRYLLASPVGAAVQAFPEPDVGSAP
jgi:hypothetical protein